MRTAIPSHLLLAIRDIHSCNIDEFLFHGSHLYLIMWVSSVSLFHVWLVSEGRTQKTLCIDCNWWSDQTELIQQQQLCNTTPTPSQQHYWPITLLYFKERKGRELQLVFFLFCPLYFILIIDTATVFCLLCKCSKMEMEKCLPQAVHSPHWKLPICSQNIPRNKEDY